VTTHISWATRCGLVVAAVCFSSALLSAHLKLMRSAPAADAVLESSPDVLQLWFSEEPLLPLSGMTLTGPRGPIKLEPLRAGSERSLVAKVGTTLEPGAYRVDWKAAGDDGHVMSGTVSFSIKPKHQPAK
jgi:methionine-rich copper-binding protein CopC